MAEFKDYIQKADWKTEKHVPIIECPDEVKTGELFDVKLSLGKEIAHPNTTEHHIRWITLFYHPDGAKYPYQVGRYEFSAHGESIEGPNKGPIYAHHSATASLKIDKPGTLHAVSFCNIHGLWEGTKSIKVK